MERRGAAVDQGDVEVVLQYGDARSALTALYEDIRTIEVGLHDLIRNALAGERGVGERGWWRALPLEIRKKCQERREEDDDPADDPYCYTDLLDLSKIMDRQWGVLSRALPNAVASNRAALVSELKRLNQVRRLVMHPVRGGIPSEDNFEFLRSLKQRLGFS